jgi:hypothetical protein
LGNWNPVTRLSDAINDLYARIRRKLPISDEDLLYRRVHPNHLKKDGSVSTAAFKDPELSVDLASLTTPTESLRRAKSDHYGLAKLVVREVRAISVPQIVIHWPEILNYSHSLVNGRKPHSAAKQLANIANRAGWEIRPNSPR